MTLRQLLDMAESHSRQQWAHTSALLAMLANVNRDPKKTRAFKPADFDPHRRAKRVAIPKAPIIVLKNVFVDRRG